MMTRRSSASASICVHAGEWMSWPPVAITACGLGTAARIDCATTTNWYVIASIAARSMAAGCVLSDRPVIAPRASPRQFGLRSPAQKGRTVKP